MDHIAIDVHKRESQICTPGGDTRGRTRSSDDVRRAFANEAD